MGKLIVGCGYLGRRVARLWQARGHAVAALTRGRADELRSLGIDPVVGDVLGPLALPSAETVLFAVAPDRRGTQGDPYAVWVAGLRNVVEALRGPSPGARLIFVGSTGVYGQTGGEEVDERSATEPQDGSGAALLAAERFLLGGARPDAVVLRFAGIYGPGRLIRSQALLSGEPIAADPDKWLNLIHVDDGAAAVLAAEARAAAGAVYNVSDGHPVRRGAFYARLANVLGAPGPRFVAPPDGPSRHDRGDRRVSNREMREELGVALRYPSYVEGLAACRGEA